MGALSLARKLRPDVLLTDLLLPDVDGIAVTKCVRVECAFRAKTNTRFGANRTVMSVEVEADFGPSRTAVSADAEH